MFYQVLVLFTSHESSTIPFVKYAVRSYAFPRWRTIFYYLITTQHGVVVFRARYCRIKIYMKHVLSSVRND